MARLPRLFVPGVPAYVRQHAEAARAQSLNAALLDAFEGFLADAVAGQQVALHAYALLPDQFHLLLSADRVEAIPRLLQSVGRRYVAAVNRHEGTAGSLWHGRYRSTLIEPEPFVLFLTRYLEGLPVRRGLASTPAEYPWSSYRHHAGIETRVFVTDAPSYWALGDTPFGRQAAYRLLAEEPLPDGAVAEIEAHARGGWTLGSSEFRQRMAERSGRRAGPLPRGRHPRATP